VVARLAGKRVALAEDAVVVSLVVQSVGETEEVAKMVAEEVVMVAASWEAAMEAATGAGARGAGRAE
jgi:hypothetical protein